MSFVRWLFRWLVWVVQEDMAADDARIRRLSLLHARRLAVRQEQAQREWYHHIAASVPPPIFEDGDNLESVQAKREALQRLYVSLHLPKVDRP